MGLRAWEGQELEVKGYIEGFGLKVRACEVLRVRVWRSSRSQGFEGDIGGLIWGLGLRIDYVKALGFSGFGLWTCGLAFWVRVRGFGVASVRWVPRPRKVQGLGWFRV